MISGRRRVSVSALAMIKGGGRQRGDGQAPPADGHPPNPLLALASPHPPVSRQRDVSGLSSPGRLPPPLHPPAQAVRGPDGMPIGTSPPSSRPRGPCPAWAGTKPALLPAERAAASSCAAFKCYHSDAEWTLPPFSF